MAVPRLKAKQGQEMEQREAGRSAQYRANEQAAADQAMAEQQAQQGQQEAVEVPPPEQVLAQIVDQVPDPVSYLRELAEGAMELAEDFESEAADRESASQRSSERTARMRRRLGRESQTGGEQMQGE